MGLVTPCATIRPFPVHFFLPFSDLCSELVASEPRREFRAPAYTFLSPFFIPESDVTLLNLPIPPRIYIYTLEIYSPTFPPFLETSILMSLPFERVTIQITKLLISERGGKWTLNRWSVA